MQSVFEAFDFSGRVALVIGAVRGLLQRQRDPLVRVTALPRAQFFPPVWDLHRGPFPAMAGDRIPPDCAGPGSTGGLSTPGSLF
jgi:hypothetical protein